MPTTALTPIAGPGRPYTFAPKGPAGAGSRGPERITALSIIGSPGRISQFSGKTTVSAPRGSTVFISLSVLALPGMKREFAGKTAYIVESPQQRRQFFTLKSSSRSTWRVYKVA